MDTNRPIAWDAQQTCGDCGIGAFHALGAERLPICSHCGHMHAMDTSNLGEDEAFYFAADGTLHVVAYEPATELEPMSPSEDLAITVESIVNNSLERAGASDLPEMTPAELIAIIRAIQTAASAV